MDRQLALDQCERVEEFRRKHRIGLLTLLFTDMVGSTRLKQTLGDGDGFDRIQEHHTLVRELLARFPEGEEIGTSGDSFFLVFAKPSDAVKFSLLLQSRLRTFPEQPVVPLQDRIGIHIGEVIIEERPGASKPKDLYGIQVDICARVMSLGQGDQILMTRASFDNSRQVLKGRELEELGPLTWASHGAYLLQGIDEPLEVCEVGETGRACLTPPADSGKARRAGSAALAASSPADKRPAARQWLIPVVTVAVVATLLLITGSRRGWLSPGSTTTDLVRCGFEAVEGYQAGQSLISRGGWLRGDWKGQLPTGGEGVAAGLFPGSAQQAFLGGVPGGSVPGVHASLRRNLSFSPDSDGEAVVEMSWHQRVTDSTNGARNRFEWLFYDQRGRLLRGLLFDNATCRIMARGSDNRLTDTGLSFERGRVYPVKLRLDFRARTWTASIDGAALGPLPLAAPDQAADLGRLSLTWWSAHPNALLSGGAAAGDNLMAFDDVKITAQR